MLDHPGAIWVPTGGPKGPFWPQTDHNWVIEVMEKFMRAERRRQELFEGLGDDREVKPRELKQGNWRQDGRRDGNCYQCGKPGHKRADCPGLGGGRSYSTSQATLIRRSDKVPNSGLGPKWDQSAKKVPKKSLFCLQVPNFSLISINERIASI